MEKQATTYFRTSVPDLDTTSVESNILQEAQTDKKSGQRVHQSSALLGAGRTHFRDERASFTLEFDALHYAQWKCASLESISKNC